MRPEYITAGGQNCRALLYAVLGLAALFGACSTPPTAKAPAPPDITAEPWYATAAAELTASNGEAKRLFESGKTDAASALVQKGEPIAARLLAASKPTLAATEAASDLDDLYGRMLLANRHYGWARLQFQKNLARWKRWQPQTPGTAQRMRDAQQAIDRVDRQMERSQ